MQYPIKPTESIADAISRIANRKATLNGPLRWRPTVRPKIICHKVKK